MITLITLTGGRQQCFSMLEKFIKAQTYIVSAQTQWLVVDDCTPPTECTLGQTYIKGPRAWEPGLNTQRYNMEAAISKVKGDVVLVLEDDDFYAPGYIQAMMDHLAYSEVVGIGNAKYYNVGVPGYKYLRNYVHAALSMTAFHAKHLKILKAAVDSGEFYFDAYLWRRVMDTRIPFTMVTNNTLSIGFKGMPGRDGLTHSHREKKDYLYDTNYAKLREWLGINFKMYEPFLRPVRKVGVQIVTPQGVIQNAANEKR